SKDSLGRSVANTRGPFGRYCILPLAMLNCSRDLYNRQNMLSARMMEATLAGSRNKPLIRAAISVLGLLSFAGAAQASVCYEEVPGPSVMTCSGNHGGNSADCASACQLVPGPPITVEKPCPGMWVQTPTRPSRNIICQGVSEPPPDIPPLNH